MSCVEYVWLGGNNELRSKTRVLKNVKTINDIPEWNYDGSSTDQATGEESEVIIRPRSLYKNPFLNSDDYLVMCDTYKPDGTPLSNNHRVWAKNIFDKNLDEEPWYGVEQEFFLINPRNNKPLGFPLKGESCKQGQYYCSVGTKNAFGRNIVEKHLRYCLEAGLNISGINAEVAPGQWEYQIGPCTGIECGDQVWISRYILQRIGELFGVDISFHPKPLLGDWNGSGCHTNYSTKSTREGTVDKTGLDVIYEHLTKLEKNHKEHMKVYGLHNKLRMTGKHETASFDKFNYDIANRGKSVRIGNNTYNNKRGYYEDRRPSSNMDPYLVSAKLFETTVLN